MSERPCTTCRWARDLNKHEGSFARCEAPQNSLAEPDHTGIPAIAKERSSNWRFKYCDTQRNILHESGCGPDGDWWEPIELLAQYNA